MLTALLSSLAFAPSVWYGPVTVSFAVGFPGNPYDPVANDVRVKFALPNGQQIQRLAYFDGKVWKSTLLSRTPGKFRATIIRNGAPVPNFVQTANATQRMKGSFIRLDGKTGFKFESGQRYWPLGYNVAWSNREVPDVAQEMRRMGASGANWSRIWANHWDNKNPFWPTDGTKLEIGDMDPKVLAKWETITEAARAGGVFYQLALFHHGPYSSRVNSNWGEHPWNVKNGGFLENPDAFFTSDRAKALAKAWIRYAIARYGHEPNIMAWELFNEVEWVDPIEAKRPESVQKWHNEMAQYIRSLDPYQHLVTTSSGLELPIWDEMDYYQPHGYPASISAMVLGLKLPTDKPTFYGEFGRSGGKSTVENESGAIRDGVYSALFANHAGAAQFWYWDTVASLNLRGEFALARKLIDSSKILDAKGRQLIRPDLQAGQGGDLAFSPGLGWAPTTKFDFKLPQAASQDMGQVSAYLQGTGHREMTKEPLKFRFTLTKPGRFEVVLTGVSTGGGNIQLSLNGALRFERTVRSGPMPTVGLDLEPGTHTVEVFNNGPDWVQIGSFRVTDIADRATAIGTGNASKAFVRVQVAAGSTVPAKLALNGLPVKDGPVSVRAVNLNGGAETQTAGRVLKGNLVGGFRPSGPDSIVIVNRK
ncbi:MAG: hypothetical protein ACOYON_15145 [Fimbriimonas sp.]